MVLAATFWILGAAVASYVVADVLVVAGRDDVTPVYGYGYVCC